jgi:hypothetical protein
MLFLRISALFFLFLFTKNIFAQSLESLACQLNPYSLTYAPEANELISCHGWSVWKYYKVSLKPEKSSSREKAYAEASIYEHWEADSQNLYRLMKPVLTSSGPVIWLTHARPIPGHFLESIINIDTGPPMEEITWSGGCITADSGTDSSPCIFTVSSRDFKSLSEWINDRKNIRSLSLFRRYPDGRISPEERK